MYAIKDLKITQILRSQEGIFAFARYPEWHYQYRFFVSPDGTIKGKTSSGFWQELSEEATSSIKSKLQSIFIERSLPIL